MSVGVLVSVEVSGFNTSRPDFQNLSPQFPVDFLWTDCSGRKSRYEAAERCGEAAIFGGERWDLFDRSNGSSTDEYQVTANSESRILFCKLNRVIEGMAARHQGRAGKNSLAMCSDNSLIYSACEAEVVGVEDQLFHLRAACLRGDEMISRRHR